AREVALRALDLDDARARIGETCRAKRCGHRLLKRDDDDSVQRPHHQRLPSCIAARSAKARTKSRAGRFDMTGKRCTDMTWENECTRRRAQVEHRAAADTRLLDVRVLRKIPMRIV